MRYWFLKNALGNHSGSIGGARKGTFSVEEKPIVLEYVIQYLACFQYSTLNDVARELTEAFKKNVSQKVNLFHS